LPIRSSEVLLLSLRRLRCLVVAATVGLVVTAGCSSGSRRGSACTVLRPLRRWARHELGLGSGDARLTGYWKRGVADFDDDD